MRLRFRPSSLNGIASAPPSKSIAIRHILLSCISRGESVLSGIGDSDDVLSTLDCVKNLGAKITAVSEGVRIDGNLSFPNTACSSAIPVGDSATLLRFIIPMCLNGERTYTFKLSDQLAARPQNVYKSLFAEKGFTFVQNGNCLTVGGLLVPGHFEIPCNVSSQFAGGLMIALSRLADCSEIKLIGECGSLGYVDLTVSAIRAHGGYAERNGSVIRVGGKPLHGTELTVPGDSSGSAVLEALRLVGHGITVIGAPSDGLQPDSVYPELFARATSDDASINVNDCPDLAPILLTLMATFGGGRLVGTSRLAYKESDRGRIMAYELSKFGAMVTVSDDAITVASSTLHPPTDTCLSHGDHRIAMALAPLLLRYGGELDGSEAVSKSFPGFFELLRTLGGDINEATN